MKFSYNWLKEFVELKVSPKKLAEDLSLFGQEVDSLEKVGEDYILDFEITPNRGDCLSILGMAREIAALYGLNLKSPLSNLKIEESFIEKSIQVKVEDPKVCPRFTARIIDGVKIGESPKWMQDKLASYGFRPVNNIVDITNYVMVAQGQPLHAFDYDKIKDGQMFIRQAKKGEEVMTLDGKNHVLPEGAVIIEDEKNIYDLAGIMGGYKSETDENTKTIILVGSIFDSVLTRKTSKFLNHVTDASYRYERGVDFEGTRKGVDFATKLILDECPSAKTGKLVDQINLKQEIPQIPFTIFDVNHLLGTNITIDQAKEYLSRLNINVKTENSEKNAESIAAPPSYRAYDIKIWQDVAEEVARIIGYSNLGTNEMEQESSAKASDEFIKKEIVKDHLKELGFTEISSYPFIDEKQADILNININDLPEIEKPLSPETRYLRPSLESSILTAVSKNPWSPEINIFEIGKVFGKTSEKWQLAVATVGKNNELLKKTVEDLKINLEIKNIDQNILDFYKVRKPVCLALIDLEKIGNMVGEYSLEFSQNKYHKISPFPPTVRDLAFIVSEEVDSQKIIDHIKNISDKILFVELFDEFSSEKFGQNKKNIAYHIWLQDLEKPVDPKEADEIIKNIISDITKDYNATLRS